MSYVIDRHGKHKQVASGYVLQPGETLRKSMLMIDGAPRTPGRFTMDNGDAVQLGDAVATDMCGGLERIRFGDGTSAVKQPHGTWLYFARNGQANLSMSLDQLAHQAKVRGGSEAFGAMVADRAITDARRDAAFDKMDDHLTNGWRGPDAKGPAAVTDAVSTHAAMTDHLSNAWRG